MKQILRLSALTAMLAAAMCLIGAECESAMMSALAKAAGVACAVWFYRTEQRWSAAGQLPVLEKLVNAVDHD